MTARPVEPAQTCTCDPGPEGQHRYWCATNGPHDCAAHRVTALDGDGESMGYTHCGICGESAEPAPDRQPSDAAVEAAYQAWVNAATWDNKAAVHDALEAAYRVDAPRPALDRETLTAGFVAFRERNGGCPDGPDCADCREIAGEEADVAMGLARPMPTEAELTEWLRGVELSGGQLTDAYVTEDEARTLAAAVLAKLNGEGS